MILIFVASESFFFLALIISYIYYSHPGGTLSSTAHYLDIRKTSVFTVFLLSSSLTILMADKKLLQGKRTAMLIWLSITIIFGLTFLIGQGTEYYGLYQENITISKNVFGSAFFTLTGFHGFHVIIGLIILSIMIGIVASKKYQSVEYDAFNTAAVYWHFVDGVWIAVFTAVYIGSIL